MDSLQLFEKDNWNIRTIEEHGKILFCGSDVAKALGYSNDSKALSDHCRWVTKRYLPHPQSPNKEIEANFINEGDLYRLVTHSKLPAAEKFECWVFDEVLPAIRRTGNYSSTDRITLKPEHEIIRASLAISFEFLRPAESGKILLMRKAFQDAGLSTACLPDYCEEKVTQSATALLKKYDSSLSAITFNRHMEHLGLLSSVSRPSSKGKIKQYWSITEAGVQYGKNLINEADPKETQPHWYEESFPQLLEMVEEVLV